ncbi:MAG: mycothiol synthase [Kineosporiaceae bacterium]
MDRDGGVRSRPVPPLRLEVCGRLAWADVAGVAALTEAAVEVDGCRPLGEHVSLHLRHGGEDPGRNILLLAPGPDGRDILVGYAHLDPTDEVSGSSAELVVHPAHRRQGLGSLLVRTALAESPDGRLRLRAYGDPAPARALAAALGFRVGEQLERLHRSAGTPPPESPLPDGIRLRPFLPGCDERPWLDLASRTLAGHPMFGGWTAQDLRVRLRENWFDPAGFLVAERADPHQDRPGAPDGDRPKDPELIGFVWSKVHGDGAGGRAHGHGRIGELYLVGVAPEHRGRGLGRALIVTGLRWLHRRGLRTVTLQVGADDAATRAAVAGLGFTRKGTDVLFSRPPGPGR